MRGGTINVENWEDLISRNSFDTPAFQVLGPAAQYQAEDTFTDWNTDWKKENLDIDAALARDTWPLPLTEDREGYYGPHHFSYWASGLRDMRNLLRCADSLGVPVRSYFDFGCASGRVLRQFAANRPDIKVFGSDLNRRHVEWVARYLPESIVVFQNHSIPTLPLPDESIDLVSAFSVFTHIEAFETSWLMELRRILRPGGIAWVTIHSEKTWEEMADDWPLVQALQRHPEFQKIARGSPLPNERTVFRNRGNRPYSSNVFYTFDYIRRNWARYLKIEQIHRRLPVFQDVVVLRKT